MQRLGDRIERVLALAGQQRARQHRLGHANLQLDPLDDPSEGGFGAHGDVHAALLARFETEVVPHVDRNRHHTLRPDVVRHQAEVAVRGDEREDSLRFPALEAHTGVEGHVVEQARVHEGQRQIGHSAELDAAVDLRVESWD